MATLGVGMGLAACQGKPLIFVYGDSIASPNQSGSSLNFLLGQAGYQVVDRVYPGSVPCQWGTQMAQDAQSGLMTAAVLDFTGNAFGCIDSPPESQAYYAAYSWYMTLAAQEFANAGVHTYIIGYPVYLRAVNSQDPLWDHLNEIYAQIAQSVPNTTFVNAGAAVETDSQQFAWTLPCLPFEPSCAPGGQNLVRAPDGGHFCPLPLNNNLCGYYASGGLRYAIAIAGAVTSGLASGSAPPYVGPPLPPPNTPDQLGAGQTNPYPGVQYLSQGQYFVTNQYLTSLNGNYRAVMQSDGNFVVYGPSGALWSSETAGSGANVFILQNDGNVVLYSPSGAVWSSRTNGQGAMTIALQNDGNLALYGGSGALWSSNS